MRIVWIAFAGALALLAGSGIGFPPADARAAAPKDAVVLTVDGEVAKPNRAGYDEKHDVFFRFHERTFDRAVQFDRAMLDELGAVRARVALADWNRPKTFSGPRLVHVLGAAGCGDGPTATLSMDGYVTELSPVDLAAHEWAVSIRADGRPHGIGGKGPLWLVYDPPGDRPFTAEEEATWP